MAYLDRVDPLVADTPPLRPEPWPTMMKLKRVGALTALVCVSHEIGDLGARESPADQRRYWACAPRHHGAVSAAIGRSHHAAMVLAGGGGPLVARANVVRRRTDGEAHRASERLVTENPKCKKIAVGRGDCAPGRVLCGIAGRMRTPGFPLRPSAGPTKAC